MDAIINCESQYHPTIQSKHVYKHSDPQRGIYAGGREQSYGLVQIHLPAHPHVSYEEAIDPEFAVEFLAKNIAAGRANMWTCYRKVAMQ